MQQHIILSSQDALYEKFKGLYATSFPIFEQRSCDQQEVAFRDTRYRLLAYEKDQEFIGFIAYWQFVSYRYVEHFAISAHLRGQGFGSRLLRAFVQSTPTPVILEIDPIVDEVTKARLRFYRSCNFVENPFDHHHPPYRSEFSPHPLVVLSSGRALTEPEFRLFQTDLRQVVMRQATSTE